MHPLPQPCRDRLRRYPIDAYRRRFKPRGAHLLNAIFASPRVHATRHRKTFCVSVRDRNRNARLEWLRVLVPVAKAIVRIGLAGVKQMVVVTGHDSKVIARRVFRCRAWDLGAALDWAGERAAAAGWPAVTVSCEPASLDTARQPFRSATSACPWPVCRWSVRSRSCGAALPNPASGVPCSLWESRSESMCHVRHGRDRPGCPIVRDR
jgi:hypothetical protein